ncbi:DUF4252 domain-containing protein [Robiginitalea sp. SC105]|uniref:DUF4252 domain-containing protein n=1 Tax=Robiginitalea sp. SC105 TaxID=2762332 RepID=UPI00163A0192|nr:DUF4252 domain-containing protein [Robiginitalea sp. SC105]MBC2839463.1 DUF4252 domain-containing protein [Robiginitalea sp. SC105]
MKRSTTYGLLFAGLASLLLFMGCSSTQSLQEYYVDSSENPNFLVLDVPANILKLDEAGLSATELEALSSLRKLNILTFRKTEANADSYKEESAKIKAILKESEFKELMKLNTKYGRGVVKYLGNEDAIDEVVIYGDSKESGFAVIRVLGKNMNPAHFMQLLQAIENADLEGEGLAGLSGLLKI